jgi:hypothetical protein
MKEPCRADVWKVTTTSRCMCFMVAIVLCSSISWREIKIEMLAKRGAGAAAKEWGVIGHYLTEQLGEQVSIVPLTFTGFMDFSDTDRSAFIFSNPWLHVKAKVRKGAKAPVTLK